jgi:hypothetical protein
LKRIGLALRFVEHDAIGVVVVGVDLVAVASGQTHHRALSVEEGVILAVSIRQSGSLLASIISSPTLNHFFGMYFFGKGLHSPEIQETKELDYTTSECERTKSSKEETECSNRHQKTKGKSNYTYYESRHDSYYK